MVHVNHDRKRKRVRFNVSQSGGEVSVLYKNKHRFNIHYKQLKGIKKELNKAINEAEKKQDIKQFTKECAFWNGMLGKYQEA